MATEDKKKKKPLVTLDAGNAAAPELGWRNYGGGDGVGSGWAGAGGSDAGDASMTLEQVQQAQHDPRPLSETGKVPGSGEVKLNDTARNMGVWEGTREAMSYQKYLDELRNRQHVESADEKRERLKRQRRNQLFAALGDGISALSNLYFTTKGSPSADQSKSMSKAMRDAYDKADKDREAEERSNLNTMLQVMNQQRLAHSAWLARKNQAELIELRKKAAEAGNVAAMKRIDELRRYHTELAQIERENKKAEQERKAELDKQEQERKDRLADSRISKEKAQRSATLQNASSNAKRAAADVANKHDQMKKRRYGGSGGRGGAPHYNTSETVVWYDKQGQKHSRTTKSNSGGGGTRKKIQHKNNLGL